MMKKILLISLLFYSITTLHAEWLLITTSEPSNSYYVETDSVKYKGKLVSYWQLDDFSSNSGKNYSSKNKKENNCTSDESRIVSQIDYSERMGAGDVIGMKENGQWKHIVPETVGDKIHKFVCNKKW